ncbi:MAG: nucleotidyl transferase AbiEii/AbiGii toxin family protein [Anaerolineae bacterium]|nr:nucleotidyl transferase AbiEii/AbiGii toxin family protein [Anaerolineae bacterium]
MKEFLKTLIHPTTSPIEASNLAREYLQALILQSLGRAGGMTALAFHGGTALRFLYALPRFSEDLDFTLEGNKDGYDFRRTLNKIKQDLKAQNYNIAVKLNDKKTVHNAFLRFLGLPFDLNLSPHPDEVLSVKIEVDTDPPYGAGLETTLVRKHVLLNLQHHDRASLLAGKLHAIMQRPYLKGRDLYDLVWYLSARDWPGPNLTLLNNALTQTGWDGPDLTIENWQGIIQNRLEMISWDKALDDVRPFLESRQEAELLTEENVLRLLQSGRSKN